MIKNNGEYSIKYSSDNCGSTVSCITLNKIVEVKVSKSDDIFEATNKVVRNFENQIDKLIAKKIKQKNMIIAKKTK